LDAGDLPGEPHLTILRTVEAAEATQFQAAGK